MNLPRGLSDAVVFARWCIEQKQDPATVARLVLLARRHATSWENSTHDASTSPRWTERSEKYARQFEAEADALGYTVEWPGLWPALSRAGVDVRFPAVSF